MSWRLSNFRAWLLLVALLPLAGGCAHRLFNRGEKDLASQIPTSDFGDEGDDGVPVGRDMAKRWADRISGRGVAADIPVASKIPWIGAPGADEPVARTHYQEAEKAMRAGKYAAARASFEEAAERLPNSPLHEDALFMIGETYFMEDKYPKAFTAYEELLAKYKRSRHLDTVVSRQFAIGDYWQRVHVKDPEFILTPNLTNERRPLNDTLGRARRAFTKVRLNHPTGPLADDSLMATANSYFVRGRYQDADYYYDVLRREHANSEHQYEAHMLGIQSKIRAYLGPEYDGIPLSEAKELIEQTARQFGGQMAAEDRQRLNRMHKQVQIGLAQRDFFLAQYYERKGYYGAAKVYHQRVATQYGETPLTTQAQERLAEIQDKPNMPAPRFTWISGLFPEKDENPLNIENANVANAAEQLRR